MYRDKFIYGLMAASALFAACSDDFGVADGPKHPVSEGDESFSEQRISPHSRMALQMARTREDVRCMATRNMYRVLMVQLDIGNIP